jgi:hypothetical protein
MDCLKDAQVCTCRTTGKHHVIQNVLVEVILHEYAIEEYCKTIAFALLTELERFIVKAQSCMIWGIIQNFIFGRIKELHNCPGGGNKHCKECEGLWGSSGGEVSNSVFKRFLTFCPFRFL